MSYFIQEYQEDLEDEDEDSEVELVVQVWIFMKKKIYLLILLWAGQNNSCEWETALSALPLFQEKSFHSSK